MKKEEIVLLAIQMITSISMLLLVLYPAHTPVFLNPLILMLQTLSTFAVVYFIFKNKDLLRQPRNLGLVALLILAFAQLFLTNHFPFPFMDGFILIPVIIYFLYLSIRLYFQRSLFGLWVISIFPTVHALVILRLLLFEQC